MAWGDLAKVSKLLESLSQMNDSGGLKTKGPGKGAADKGKAGGKGATTRVCPWEDCKAAREQRRQKGDSGQCHCCKRNWGQVPPVEKMTESAYSAVVKTKQPKEVKLGKGGAKGNGKGKGKSAAAGAQAEPSAEELAELRKKRLEGLKTGVPPVDLKGTPAKPTIAEEVALAFNAEEATGQQLVRIEEEIVTEAERLSAQAKEVVASLQAEKHPSKKALLTAEESLSKLLQGVASCASVESSEAAEKALKATTQAMAALEAAGTLPSDEDMVGLSKRKERQARELTRLKDKAPTTSLRMLALVEAKKAYQRQLQADSDFADKGRAKALEREQQRLSTIRWMEATLRKLREEAKEKCTELSAEHEDRTAAKVALGEEVLVLLEEKIDEVDELMVVDEEDAGLSFADPLDDEVQTPTESERDRLQAQLLQLRAAAAGAPAQLQQQAAVDELAAARTEIARLTATLREASAAAAALPAEESDDGQSSADNDPAKDLWREFTAADVTLLPTLPSPMPASEQKSQATMLAAFFKAVPWGSTLPALTFHVLGAHPSVVHGIIGDPLWKDCWGDKHGRITNAHIVPYSILNMLKWAVEQAQLIPDATAMEEGKERWLGARADAAKRRGHGAQY